MPQREVRGEVKPEAAEAGSACAHRWKKREPKLDEGQMLGFRCLNPECLVVFQAKRKPARRTEQDRLFDLY
jgi:hypothetical protein